MHTVSNLDVINRIISRRPSKRNRKRDYSYMDEQEVRRVVKDYSDMIKRISYNYLQRTYDSDDIYQKQLPEEAIERREMLQDHNKLA